MRTEVVTVVLADDHELFRMAVREELEERGFDVVGEAEDAPGAVSVALTEVPDICLLDVRMRGDGIRAAQEIAAQLPSVKAVMLTATRDDDVALAALRAGARGYVLKDLDLDMLADALRRVAAGDLAFPGRLLRRALDELRLNPNGAASLARDDWRVAELLGEGLSASQVADETSLATGLVRDRIAAIAAALRTGDGAGMAGA
jgi:DNA-binding NarL/FixJ family response regulator